VEESIKRSDVRDPSAPTEPERPARRGHIGLIVAASMFGGLILALVLTLLVFGGATEPVISGVALLTFNFSAIGQVHGDSSRLRASI
jgi:hypothetical protein